MEKYETIKAFGLTTRVWCFKEDWQKYGCAECCNGDRCDEDCDAKYTRGKYGNCPHCKATGWINKSDLD